VAQTPIGSKAKIEYLRDGKTLTAEPMIQELKAENEEAQGTEQEEEQPPKEDRLGLSVTNLTPQVARQLQLEPGDKGVVVAGVVQSGAAAEKGIQRGDLIVEVNRHKVANVDEYRKYNEIVEERGTPSSSWSRGVKGTTLFVAF